MKTVKVAILKSIAKNLLIFSPLILGMILTNYFVDPGRLFKAKGCEEDLARIFMQGFNVANVNNYDERLLQMHYIKADKGSKDIIVLGSSRVMQINADNLGRGKFFNHGVSGATLEDFFSICEMYEEKKKFPGTVIVGLDPWILNKNNGQERWKSISTYYYAFMQRLGIGTEVEKLFLDYDSLMFAIKRKLSLFSPSYFQTAIRHLARSISEWMKTGIMRMDYYPTQSDSLDVDIRLADGTIALGKNYISRNREEVKASVNQNLGYALGGFYELDRFNQNNFEKFIEYLLRKNVKIVFFLPPYHPYGYTQLINATEYQIIEKAEVYFRTIGAQNHIMVIGSYDPLQCGLSEEDFDDGMHPRKQAIAKLIKFITIDSR